MLPGGCCPCGHMGIPYKHPWVQPSAWWGEWHPRTASLNVPHHGLLAVDPPPSLLPSHISLVPTALTQQRRHNLPPMPILCHEEPPKPDNPPKTRPKATDCQ